VPPTSFVQPRPPLPLVTVPAMGIWSDGDRFLTEAQMIGSAAHVADSWRYERVDGAGHWLQLDKPDVVNDLLLDFIATHENSA
jgi:pimeloyl-ACP methyl ester carboxylesterase